jgi:AcrR family transcriptional regulator
VYSVVVNASRNARQRARAELTTEIKDEARRQLATGGADGLSLRAVARELGMVSSAIYRYFPSRDDLVTAMIIDAYDALGAEAEAAEAVEPRTDYRGRWRATCRAVRAWALKHPHEYALIYGSPIPGYQAPQDTVTPAARVPTLMLDILGDAFADHKLAFRKDDPSFTELLVEQIGQLAAATHPELPHQTLTRALIAWTQLFGMISFELFGQFVGTVDPTDDFFEHATQHMADLLGLPKSAKPA